MLEDKSGMSVAGGVGCCVATKPMIAVSLKAVGLGKYAPICGMSKVGEVGSGELWFNLYWRP
jgi:hypothetical protein